MLKICLVKSMHGGLQRVCLIMHNSNKKGKQMQSSSFWVKAVASNHSVGTKSHHQRILRRWGRRRRMKGYNRCTRVTSRTRIYCRNQIAQLLATNIIKSTKRTFNQYLKIDRMINFHSKNCIIIVAITWYRPKALHWGKEEYHWAISLWSLVNQSSWTTI